MISPISYKPIVTDRDLKFGSITRYFAKYVSSHGITEIDKQQYTILKSNPYYITIEIPWIITGNLYPASVGRNKIFSIQEQNKKIVDFYDKKLPGLSRKLKNLLEYASPTINTPPPITNGVVIPPTPVSSSAGGTTEPAAATLITVSPTFLTFNYQINSTVPTSQSVSITADGAVSDLSVISGSSWLSASLLSTSTPTTLWISPIVSGLYSGSYTTTASINTTQTGVTSASIGITLNVTNNPDILFVYEPGMPLTSATFTRATSASYNELVS